MADKNVKLAAVITDSWVKGTIFQILFFFEEDLSKKREENVIQVFVEWKKKSVGVVNGQLSYKIITENEKLK